MIEEYYFACSRVERSGTNPTVAMAVGLDVEGRVTEAERGSEFLLWRD